VDPLYELALLVKAGQRELERRTNEVMRPLGLTAAQADALAVIGQAGPLSLKELGELLIAEAGHPSRLVDRLVEAGLVERRPDAGDRRQIVLSLTRRGRELEGRVEEARTSLFELARTLIGERDVEPALDLLHHLTQYSSYADLIARRRGLAERHDRAEPASPRAK
jgi:MarR family transcriptional regulator, organic hydroperoxide resistance regulator